MQQINTVKILWFLYIVGASFVLALGMVTLEKWNKGAKTRAAIKRAKRKTAARKPFRG